MNENAMLTGKPSIDRPWMKFYPDVLRGIQVPACTVEQYLSVRAADPNVVAMHYYGVDITWGTVFRKVDATARALQVLGIKQGDQIPVFLRSVPEFIYRLIFGKPSIVSEHTGTAGLISEGRNGFVYHNDDPQQLAVLLEHAIEHPEELASMRTECRKMYEQYYSKEAFEQTLRAAVEDLTAKK